MTDERVVELHPKKAETPPEIAQAARDELERIIIHQPFIAIMFVTEINPSPKRRCEIAGIVPNMMSVGAGLARYAFAITEAGDPEPIEEGETGE